MAKPAYSDTGALIDGGMDLNTESGTAEYVLKDFFWTSKKLHNRQENWSLIYINTWLQSSEGWGVRYSGFQVTGMIKWGQISQPKKVPRASNKT